MGENKTMWRRVDLFALVLSVLLVSGAVAERFTLMPPADARVYQERVRKVFETFPTSSGDWVSQNCEIPPAAMKLLRPNSIMSRRYTNVVTGQGCSVLLVDCTDARDLVCHYPPVCYPGQGWKLVSSQPKEWSVKGQKIVGTDYEFSRVSFESGTGIVAANSMILPDGSFKADMTAIEDAAKNVQMRTYGAAQIQVIVDGNLGALEREKVIQAMLELHKPLFDAIHSAGR
jgi:hypothetical protein